MARRPGAAERLKRWFARLAERRPVLGHVVAMVRHYGAVRGNVLAGAVTYYGFLSFFPLIAIAFSVVGFVSGAFPEARDTLVEAVEQVFPGIVTVDGAGDTISLSQIEDASRAVGLIGLVALLYTGLGWLSGLRHALTASFELPQGARRGFLVGKAIDLGAMTLLGVILFVSVGITSAAQGFADSVLGTLALDGTTTGTALLWVLSFVTGLLASTLLFWVMFRLLGKPELPSRPLWQGALLGAVGFELLKVIVVMVLGGIGGSAFAPLAIAVTLILWINYFSRLVFVGASWAITSPLSAEALQERRRRTAQDLLPNS